MEEILLILLFIAFSCKDPETDNDEYQNPNIVDARTTGNVDNPFANSHFDITNARVPYASLHIVAEDGSITFNSSDNNKTTPFKGVGTVPASGDISGITFSNFRVSSSLPSIYFRFELTLVDSMMSRSSFDVMFISSGKFGNYSVFNAKKVTALTVPK